MKHPVDAHVGMKIRQRRTMLEMTQEALADKIGVKFQQLQKYETGANRVSASRLWSIAEALGVEPNFFFEGLSSSKKPERDQIPSDILSDPQVLKLVRTFYLLGSNVQKKILALIETVVAESSSTGE